MNSTTAPSGSSRGSAQAQDSSGGGAIRSVAAPRPAGGIRLQINLILGGQVFPGKSFEVCAEALAILRGQMDTTNLSAAGLAPANRFVLRRCGDVWQVVLEGEPDFFGHTAGMTFIDHCLKHPGEPIHPVVLLARIQGQEPVQQRSLSLDDQETTRGYLREMDRLRAILESDEASAGEKQVAEEHLAQLEQADGYIFHRSFDQAARASKTVRQAINRSIHLLETARDASGRPHPVLERFAAHLRNHLLKPPLGRSAPLGHLIYEPPEGVRWV
jgi:hypothetical protein